ncbi:uncharacterized protein [Anabrus simplex]|uniref:uncharacterized protein n=1 Tax=Anabrus simplex TaxID=316456 RepID=UPI0034DD3B32
MALGLGSYAHSCLRYVLIIAVGSMIVLFYAQGNVNPEHMIHSLVTLAEQKNDTQQFGKEGYLVWSPSCQIPDVEPYHESIRSMLQPAEPIVCTRDPPLTYTSMDNASNHVLRVDSAMIGRYIPKGRRLTCCYSVITRYDTPAGHNYTKEADNLYNISKCQDFEHEVFLSPEEEFTLVRCGYYKNQKNRTKKEVYANTHAVVPIKPSVKFKLRATKPGEDDQHLNVLLVGIDSMSRLNLFRTMPRTVAHLRHTGWVDLKGYNKMGDNTFPNLNSILTGLSVEQLTKICWPTKSSKLDDCPFIWKEFHNRSYVTAYAEDEPTMSTFNYHKTGFVQPPTDYYLRPYMLAAINKLPTKKRNNLDICLGPSSTTDHLLRYATDFVTTFRNTLYFALIWLNNFSHNNHNTPAAMDLRVLQFLNELIDTGALNTTFIVFFSDHGMRFGKIRETFVGWLEERLPFIYFWIPEWFRKRYPESFQNLIMNSDRLTSPYDLHDTLRDVLEKSENSIVSLYHNVTPECPKCKSLFSEVIEDRSCEDAGIAPHWCTCTQYETLSVKSETVQAAARYVLTEIQMKLKKAGNSSDEAKLCAELQMSRVIKARSKIHGDKKAADHDDYVIMFETLPGEGLFEATVRHWHESSIEFNIMGIVSRINSYASHSTCVKDAELKLYCYCSPT